MESTFYSRRRRRIFWLFLASIPAVLWGTWWALQSNSNRVEDWLPQDFEETRQLYEFSRTFGSDELLMISWPGCTLDDPRLPQFAERLRLPPLHTSRPPSPPTWGESVSQFFLPRKPLDKPLFRLVLTGPEAIEELSDILPNASRRAAQSRLQGWIVGKDNPELTCAVAFVSYESYGGAQRHAAVDYVYQCAGEIEGLSPQEIHVAGTTIEGVAIDRASGDYLMVLNAASYGICFLLMLISFRSVWLGILLFVNAFFCQLLSMALVYYAGGKMDSVLLLVPSLVYVLTISGGVHLINYYRDAIDAGGLSGAPARAVGYALAPCMLAAATTSLGLWSLLVSQLLPIRNFGFYAAIAVLSGTAVLLLLLPWQLEHFPPLRWSKRRPAPGSGRAWQTLAALIERTHWGVAASGVLLLLVGGYGVSRITTSAQLHNMFSDEARVIQDYAWLEGNIGPLIPIEVVVEIPIRQDEFRYDEIVERIRFIERVRQEVQDIDGIDVATSAATYLPPLPEGAGLGYIVKRRTMTAKLKNPANRQRLVDLRQLVEQQDKELWRVSARVNASQSVDYGVLVAEVHRRLPPLFRAAEQEGMANVQAVVTGGVPVVHKAQDQLLSDLIGSFLCAFGLIALAMVALFCLSSSDPLERAAASSAGPPPDLVVAVARNTAAGLLSMIPNVLPAVVVFGAMGLIGIQIEIGTMLTVSVAMGIAVDDTLHYLTWFRRGIAEGRNRREAIEFAYKRCGNAMIQTTAIVGFGLLVFSLSPFGPIARFGWMMFAMLAAGLVGDLVVLPAILVGPLGAVFHSRVAPAVEVAVSKKTAAPDNAVVQS